MEGTDNTNPSNQGAAGTPENNGIPGNGEAPDNSEDLTFRYSDATSMNEFFRDYPQYAENPNFNKYKTVKAFAEGYESLVSKLGTSVSIPDENATEEQLNEFYNKLGRPEAPEKYEFEDKLPEGITVDEQLDLQYRDLAYKLGLTAKQAQELRNFHNSAVSEAYNVHQKQVQASLAETHTKNVEAIKQMWGPDYKEKTKIAMNTARSVLSQATLDYLDATGLGDNKDIVKDFYELSKRLSSGRFIDDGGVIPPAATLEDLESAALKILRTQGWQNDPVLKRKYEELTQQRADMLYKE